MSHVEHGPGIVQARPGAVAPRGYWNAWSAPSARPEGALAPRGRLADLGIEVTTAPVPA